jgi:ketosteroid isomerase-like protein
MNDGQRAAMDMLRDYYAAFNTYEVPAIVAYFNEPALLLGPQGGLAAPNRDALAPVIGPFIDGLRARGFARSELTVARVERLSESTQLVTGVATRYLADGRELERAGLSYVLQSGGGPWRIAVLITHDVQQPGSGS